MFAALKRFDLVIEGKNGGPCVLQMDHREAAEIEEARELSTAFAIVKVLEPIRVGSPTPEVRYYLSTMPPAYLVEAVAAAGGRVFVGPDPRQWEDVTDSAGGARPREAEVIANEAMDALAQRTLKEAGLPLSWDGLSKFEQSFLEEDIDVDLDDEDDEDDEDLDEDGEPKHPRDASDGGEAWWTKVVKLAACAGAVLGRQTSGRWIVSMDHTVTFPLLFQCEKGDKQMNVNLLGKAEKFLDAGMEDSLAFLVSVVTTMVNDS